MGCHGIELTASFDGLAVERQGFLFPPNRRRTPVSIVLKGGAFDGRHLEGGRPKAGLPAQIQLTDTGAVFSIVREDGHKVDYPDYWRLSDKTRTSDPAAPTPPWTALYHKTETTRSGEVEFQHVATTHHEKPLPPPPAVW